jgi:RNA polymerase sigma factor (sigma-70 family)
VGWKMTSTAPGSPAVRRARISRECFFMDIEDAEQEAHLRLLERQVAGRAPAATPEHYGALHALVTRSIAVDVFRRLSNAQACLAVLSQKSGVVADDPTKNLSLESIRIALFRALTRLPASDRTLLVLRIVDGLSFKEIARRLNLGGDSHPASCGRLRNRLTAILCMLRNDPSVTPLGQELDLI